MPKRVLCTGATGFVAGHTIVELLRNGYNVRGTVRNPAHADTLRASFHKDALFDDEKLQFCVADLTEDGAWDSAVRDCTYVLHLASPVSLSEPKDENEMICPARDGTRRVLQAAHSNGVDKVVFVSSTVAVGLNEKDGAMTEEDWTNIELDYMSTYQKSKTLAETAAWDFVREHPSSMKLSVICPSLILGPAQEHDYGVSLEIVKRLLDRSMPFLPRVGFVPVDVRCVVHCIVTAMESAVADGERFIVSNEEFMWWSDIARVLNEELPSCQSRPVTTLEIPNFLVVVLAVLDAKLQSTVPRLGKKFTYNSAKAREKLHWRPRSTKEAILSAGQSLIDNGVTS